jgi:3-hydroxymyristoyl/3-hydroxydecanoyl-(acyl carrier protein) dehydratase
VKKLPVNAVCPAWYRRTTLLTGPPVLIDRGDGGGAFLAAALSEAGQELIFAHGRTAFRQQLIKSCAAGSDHAAASIHEWIFVDEAILSAADRNDQIQALLQDRQSPCLPDVIAHNVSGDSAEYLFDIPAGLTWFDGHFPGDPMLPAVVQVDWAIHFGQRLGFNPDRFAGFARLKFMAVIVPDTLIRLSLVTSGAALRFVYRSATGLHSKGTVKFF